jgi:Uma2 family endonuclease
LKLKYYRVLDEIVDADDLGLFFPDGALWTNKDAGVSNIPDGMFISWDALERGRARYVGEQDKAIEVEGSPDMVMEVVSRSSVRKDTVSLMKCYWAAGVKEYWLVDARREIPVFRILLRGPRGFRDTRSRGGWHRSAVFVREFKLDRRIGRMGHAAYELKVR